MKIILIIIILAISGSGFSQTLNSLGRPDIIKQNYKTQLNSQLSVSYAYIRNLGNFGDLYEKGNAYYINYGKYFPDSWLAEFRAGYIEQKLRSGVDSGAYKNFNVYPIHIGGRYYVYKNVFMPYFSFMNGINLISTSNYVGPDDQPDQSLIRYAFQVGFGFDVKFARQFGVNFNINFNNSFYEDYDLYEEQNSKMMTGFEYGAGFIYNFGK